MPNTLVHIGLQGLATRAVWRAADPGWILLGCVIPDLPWVLRRLVLAVAPPGDLLNLHLYAAVQSSLLLCLILSAVFAALSAKPGRTFGLLAVGSLLHLLLDACEIKWSNGALLFVPFDWRLAHFDWVWPDGGLVQALSLAGLAVYAFLWRGSTSNHGAPSSRPPELPQEIISRQSRNRTRRTTDFTDSTDATDRPASLTWPGRSAIPGRPAHGQRRVGQECPTYGANVYVRSGSEARSACAAVAAALLGLYFALPAFWLHGPERAGDYGVAVLRAPAERTGRAIAMDRVPLLRAGAAARVVAINGEAIEVENPGAGGEGTVSLAGVFTAPGRIRVERWHAHPRGLRDAESAAGLALVGLFWAVRGWRGARAGTGRA